MSVTATEILLTQTDDGERVIPEMRDTGALAA